MEILTNPWIIIIIAVSVIVGNIAALKYTAKMKFERVKKKKAHQLPHDSEPKK